MAFTHLTTLLLGEDTAHGNELTNH